MSTDKSDCDCVSTDFTYHTLTPGGFYKKYTNTESHIQDN